MIGNKCNESSSKNTSEKDPSETECQSEDDRQPIEAPVIDRADAMSAENRTTPNVCIFNISGYREMDFFLASSRSRVHTMY